MKRIWLLPAGFFALAFLLSPACLHAQIETAERYLAATWQKTPLPTFLVPYQAEREPCNSIGKVMLPGPVGRSGWTLSLQSADGKSTFLRQAERGAGDYLSPIPLDPNFKQPKNLAFDFVSFDGNHGELAFCVKLSKSSTGIGFLTDGGNTRYFPFNNKAHSLHSPCFSADGQTLYFASNQAGGQGGFDIWSSRRLGAAWSTPEALPAPLNSPGDDLNPTVQPDGSIIFARRARPDDDLDLYQLQQDSLRLLPYPINSRFDDLGATSAPNGRLWVCSTRPTFASNEAGPPQLFRLTPKPSLSAQVKHQRSGRGLPGIPVSVSTGSNLATTLSGPEGRFELWLEPAEQYQLLISADDYDTLRLKAVNLAQRKVELALMDKQYWDLQLKFTEYGKVPVTPIRFAIYENGNRIDSLEYHPTQTYYRRLRPSSAYLVNAYSGDYPPQARTFNTTPPPPTDSISIAFYVAANRRMPPPVKDPHGMTLDFGWPVGAYTRIYVQDAERRPLAGVPIVAYYALEPMTDAKIPVTDAQGSSWFRFEKNEKYVLVAVKEDRIGYTELDTQSDRAGNDTLSSTLLVSELSGGEPFLSIPRPEDPILLQAGKAEELRILLALLSTQSDLRVELSGHADPSEGPQAMRKSKDAAEFAADFLFLHDIARDRVRVVAYGSTRPRFTGDSPVERAGNKRVEVRRL